mmetsp:Transcript_70147/g.186425  ORF Transcript_70147/g.186425 Transcript_70147/m.186425 type:complete len:227 (+) Transcript_70147:629-1309(+)
MDSNASTGVALAVKAVRDGAHCLDQAQCRCCIGHLFWRGVNEPLGCVGVKAENGHLRRELVNDVTDRQPRVELDVARAQRRAALRTRLENAGRRQGPGLLVVAELPDEVHAQVGNVRDPAIVPVQDHRVRVWITLALLLRGLVVVGVVHVLIVLRLHLPAHVGVIQRAELQGVVLLALDAKHSDGCIPIVDDKHVLALPVQGEVARRCAVSAAAPELCELARLGAH